ncbi:ulp1 protease family, C-terminal catalytic domain-containing protein [Artemisia annua]|uniref:Ulp1 protease family, C-terminal catalytic domain-containing protein n=1 Tax=Artemisia annua TaxID=35608 RepID=A0A2U1PSV6_ARTAN|nr:ulp1 protease family, C-terminal catalytic domain-containing protein [Artemisia annua]
MPRQEPIDEAVFVKVLVDGKQDDTKMVKVMGVADKQNSDEPNVLEDNVIDQARENVIEGENLDKANVSDKEKGDLADVENNVAKKKMDEKRDEQMEKMEHESEGNRKGKCAAGKRKMKPQVVKGTKKVDTENGDCKDKDAAHDDGNSSDDDFVSPKKTKIPKVTVSKKKIFTTKRFEVKRKVGSGTKKAKNRVHLRNPPDNLFRVITQLSDIQKKDVRSMGFGEVLEFKISKVPTRLAYWLLDRFDENTCSLDVNGKRINITPYVVNNMLGVPKGDVHIKTRDNSDYRNPLIRQWKEQFGEDVKKYFNSHVAKEILKTKRGGWMFKLNFLVLFFSTIGELNLSNTVNLRFLPCINNEEDIKKIDWCTYIIECLVRTKRSWNRNAHFNGPVILLLVVYATLDSPIKHCSSELLYKLEGEMFPNQPLDDSAADDRGADEVIHDEDVDEDIGWEDDVFEDPGSESVYVVNNMLGVPKGDVHIKTRDNSDYRNPLIRQWKEQFGEHVKKYFNTHVAKEILKTKRGGWMFKLNFLVLFFSTIGELNLSNTVNLRFLPCINNEDDILKIDWCTYIIECLVRTKRSWNRNAHFNGPVILLLVVYATLDSPIKHCSSELLYKLEGEMFPNQPLDDSAADDRGADEVIHDEDVDEDIGWEDDVFEDPGSESVPVNAEVMKKNVSLYLKRAGELRDMADRLLVKGLEDNPDDNGFMELKEHREQMFVNRKYYHNPEDNEGLTKETYDKCFTPEKGVNKKDSGAADEYVFPFTQVAIAMSDEPPATQGKVVVDDLAEDQVLLDSLRDYVSQEPADGGGFKTPDHPILGRAHLSNTSNRLSRFGRESMGNKSNDIVPVYPDHVPLNVVLPNLAHARAKLPRLLPEVYRSPYMTREVSVVDGLGKHEREVGECFFSARFSETDIVFKTRFVGGERVVLESLFPGIDIASGAIDLFTHVLNNAEKHRSRMTVKRLFCHTSMLTSDMESWGYERMFAKFVENMDNVVKRSEYKTLDGVQLVFFPVIQGRHFFVVCMNMKDGEVQLLDNLLLPDKTDDERFSWFIIHLISVFEDYLLHKKNAYYERMTHATRKVLPLGCRTTNNFVDCGVFTMRHTETYKGNGADLCCLSKEGKKQLAQLRDLRIKYAVKILLSDCNLVKTDIDKEVNAFRNVPVEEKKRLRMAALETIKLRVSTKFEVK